MFDGGGVLSEYPPCRIYVAAEGKGAGSVSSLRQTRSVAEGNGAGSARSRRRNINLAEGGWRARVSARIAGCFMAHSRSISGGVRGRRGRNTNMVVRHVCYCCGCLPGPDPGGTLAVVLNDGDDFSCGYSGEKIWRRGGSWLCVLAKQRRYASPSPSWPSLGFKQPLASVNECQQRFFVLVLPTNPFVEELEGISPFADHLQEVTQSPT